MSQCFIVGWIKLTVLFEQGTCCTVARSLGQPIYDDEPVSLIGGKGTPKVVRDPLVFLSCLRVYSRF